MVKLKKLLSSMIDVVVFGSKEIEITGLSANSKTIAPGNLFVAKKGLRSDGAQFIGEAINAGASAVLSDLHDPFLPSHITQLIASKGQISDVEAKLAATYYHFPSKELFLVGVTGTNGKTTTTYLIRHLLSSHEHPCGLIGSIEWVLGNKIQPSSYTTPDVITNHRSLREMLNGDCLSAAMEVSSHALDQKRTAGLEFDVAIFTNLTQDHLDYHQTMEEYALAKARLFSDLSEDAVALFNMDSPIWMTMSKSCRARKMTYGMGEGADLRAQMIELSDKGTRFQLDYLGEKASISSPLIGSYNVYNILAAIGTAIVYGMALDEIKAKLTEVVQVPGRLERIENQQGFSIFVDYAHTDDALENVLKALVELKQGRLFVVFGCGGDRDRMKRPKMGQAATTLADFSIITSDNPRGEDPIAIIEDVLKGCQDPLRYLVEPDRKMAIEQAISMLGPTDLLLIAGKGHERYQIIGSRQVIFDDRDIARQALSDTRISSR
jgi:UDP-N-acetylmuramoyl-L-alanyl-D-glutamate--2,6-diaminopimelate ligase